MALGPVLLGALISPCDRSTYNPPCRCNHSSLDVNSLQFRTYSLWPFCILSAVHIRFCLTSLWQRAYSFWTPESLPLLPCAFAIQRHFAQRQGPRQSHLSRALSFGPTIVTGYSLNSLRAPSCTRRRGSSQHSYYTGPAATGHRPRACTCTCPCPVAFSIAISHFRSPSSSGWPPASSR